MIKPLLFFLSLISIGYTSWSQELNCKVIVNADQVQTTEREVFKEMEVEFAKFMNTTKWTNDQFNEHETIRCNMIITINEMPSIGQFKASVQVVSSRPIYGTDYETILLNFGDKDFEFEYVKFQPLRFNENTFTSNITSLLAYYAYMILGFDYDSFSELGGTPHFQKAFTIVNNAAQSGYKGWTQFSGTRNRYWLVANTRNAQYELIRKAMYTYHIKGLDQMITDYEKGEENITKAVADIFKANRARPRSAIVISLMDAKAKELIKIYSKSAVAIKRQAFDLLKSIDPGRSDEYRKILN